VQDIITMKIYIRIFYYLYYYLYFTIYNFQNLNWRGSPGAARWGAGLLWSQHDWMKVCEWYQVPDSSCNRFRVESEGSVDIIWIQSGRLF